MKAYKGFDKNLQCRGFQYEIGGEYEEEKADLCNSGFHACEHPLDCFVYYAPADSRFCEVELDEVSNQREGCDTKVCAKKIKVGAEIGIPGLIKATFEHVKSRCTTTEQGADNTALTGGDWSALSGGYHSALSGGNQSALSGGDHSALSGGYRSALSGGYRSALSGGDQSALSGGNRSALSGGYRSALSGGDQSALSGGNRSVVYGGEGAKVRAGKGSVLALQYWKDGEFVGIKFKEVDGVKIKADTYYKLDGAGRFIQVKEDVK